LTSLNTRCFYQQQGVNNYVEVNFRCPSPGLTGNIVTMQNIGGYNLELLEVEVLGKTFFYKESRANPTIVSYNASAVKIYIATRSLVRFENKSSIFYFEKMLYPMYYNAGVVPM
jgi:hypothetical protein